MFAFFRSLRRTQTGKTAAQNNTGDQPEDFFRS
jgi:hypothetical protein